MIKRLMVISLAMSAFALSFTARADFVVPRLTGPVVDEASILDGATAERLDQGLRTLRDQTGTQITVLTVQSLGGEEIEQASIKTTDAWKLGSKKGDKGILLLVAPNERRVRIEVGQGLEGSLPDAYSNRIVRDVITPSFKQGDYSGGVLRGVMAIVHFTNPDVDANALFGAAPETRADPRARRGLDLGTMFWIVFFIIVILSSLFRGGGGGRGRRLSGWEGAALGYGLGRASSGWGGGGSGGGGGGGWSGGGGGFSGGGASGGW